METINFKEHKFRKEGKYKCKCGYKFKRVRNDYWTENPFNKLFLEKGVEVCNDNCIKKINENLKEKKCPKCNNICINLDTN